MPEPTKIPRPFADSGDKNSIPDSSGGLGFASWQEGFPAITGTPFAQGGVAPKRADFNGIFNALSLATVWQQQGGFYDYSNAVDYEVGNVVLYNSDLYLCKVANGPSSSVKNPTNAAIWAQIISAKGGTLGGTLIATTHPALSRQNDNSFLTLCGGTTNNVANGAFMYLYGANGAQAGAFRIYTGGTSHNLFGQADGSLTWDGSDVATVESGTFTPTIKGQTTTGSFTYTTQSGTYVKIGNLCYVAFSLEAKIVTVPTGYAVVSGLPYNGETANQTLVVNLGGGTWLNYPALTLRVATSGACNIYGLNNSSSINALNPCAFTASATVDTVIAVRASGIYKVA